MTVLTSAGSEKRQPSFPKTCICLIHRPAHHCASQPGKVGGVAVECVLVGKMLHPISLRSSPRTTLCKAAASKVVKIIFHIQDNSDDFKVTIEVARCGCQHITCFELFKNVQDILMITPSSLGLNFVKAPPSTSRNQDTPKDAKIRRS